MLGMCMAGLYIVIYIVGPIIYENKRFANTQSSFVTLMRVRKDHIPKLSIAHYAYQFLTSVPPLLTHIIPNPWYLNPKASYSENVQIVVGGV